MADPSKRYPCGSSNSPRSCSNKRSSLSVSVDRLSVLQDEYKRKADELSELQASRAKQEREFLKDAGVDLLDTYAVDKALSKNRNNRLLLNKPRDKRIEELSKELEEIENDLVTARANASEKKAAHFVSPSKLDASNIRQARGSVDVHDRDSGVARHEAFLTVLRSVQKSGWEAKKQFLMANCPAFFEVMGDDAKVPAAAIIDRQLGKLREKIFKAQADNSGTAANILSNRESVFSEELTFRLNCFCEESGISIRFSHQYPTAIAGSMEDKADISCFSLDDEKNRRLRGHIEVKRDNALNARWQLLGYASETYHERIFLSFCLTIDHTDIALYGFMQSIDPGNEKRTFLEHSLLCQVGRGEKVAVESLLGSYFLAVILTSKTFDRNPHTYSFCPFYPEAVYMKPKVFRAVLPSSDVVVAKVYDYGPSRIPERRPNSSFWKTVLSEAEIDVHTVQNCENVTVLVRPFFDGDHTPTHPLHVALLCDQLALLHTAGKWHGDVLCQNVCFGVSQPREVEGDGQETDEYPYKTSLIDFDYSHRAEYPEFWNTGFPERHPEAKAGLRVRQEHDVYSAIAIFCMHFNVRESYQQEPKPSWKEFAAGNFDKHDHPYLLPSWEGKSAKDVAEWIRGNEARFVRSPLDQLTLEIQTGSPPEKRRKA